MIKIFNWKLFWIISVICLPGIIIIIPGTLRTLESLIEKNSGDKRPNKTVLFLLSSVQSFLLVLISSAIGTKLSPIIGFEAPFFQSIISGEQLWSNFYHQLMGAFFYGLFGSVIFLSIYYFYYRPRLGRETVLNMENLRNNIGLMGRIFYGGIVEEVLTRWGLLTLFIWLFKLIFSTVNTITIWISIIVSGIIFALGHLPSYLGAGCKKTPLFIFLMLSLNLMASLVFGWLFWQYGLLSAMMAHALFHIIWYPFDKRFENKREQLLEEEV